MMISAHDEISAGDRLRALTAKVQEIRREIELRRHPDRAPSVHVRRIRSEDSTRAEREHHALHRLESRLRHSTDAVLKVRRQAGIVEEIRELILAAPDSAFGASRGTREEALTLLDHGLTRNDPTPHVLHEACVQVLGPDYFGRLRPRLLILEEAEKVTVARAKILDDIEATKVTTPASWSDPATPADAPPLERARA